MSALSDKVLALTTAYLGPASKVFLDRQLKFHLNGIALDAITPAQLGELAHWVRVSAGLLIDKQKAEILSNQIARLK